MVGVDEQGSSAGERMGATAHAAPAAATPKRGRFGARVPRSVWGTVAVVAFALVAGGVVLIKTRYAWWFVRGPEYGAAFTDVGGLGDGALVRYAGLGVGHVRRVAIDPVDARRVLVTFRVREGTPVLTSTRAVVGGLGGVPTATTVDLRPGALGAPRLAPGSRVAVDESPTLEQTLDRVGKLLDRADTVIAATRPLVEGDVFGHIARTTANIDTMVGVATRGVDRWGPRIAETVRHTEEVVARTDRVLAVLDSARPVLAQAPGEMVSALAETRALLNDVRAGVSESGGLQAMMRDLTLASDNLARLSARLERDPVSVLQRRRAPRKDVGPALRD